MGYAHCIRPPLLGGSPTFAQGLCPCGPAGLSPLPLSQLGFVASLQNRGRMGYAHCIRPPLLGGSPTAARRGPPV